MVTSTSGRWDEFVRLAKEYVGSEWAEDSERLEVEEINYKVEMGHKLAAARAAVLAEADGWAGLVKSGLNYNPVNNFTKYRFLTWLNERPDDVREALQAIWTRDDRSLACRISAFSDSFPASASETSREGHRMDVPGVGTRMRFISALLMGLDVHQYPPFMVTVFNKAYERTGYGDRSGAQVRRHCMSTPLASSTSSLRRRGRVGCVCATALTRSRWFGGSRMRHLHRRPI